MQITLEDAQVELVDKDGQVAATLDLVELEMFLEKIELEAALTTPQRMEALANWVHEKSDNKLTLSVTQSYVLFNKARVAYNEFKKKLNVELGLPSISVSPHSTAT
jgi:hypothetical protein